MTAIFGIPIQALLGQLLLGLVNGSFYAVLSLGLAVIFGLLNVINFAHGALYMLGAFVAWMGLQYLGLGYWTMLIVAPIVVGIFGIVLERTLIRHLYKLDHLYGLLLTFGLTLLIEGIFRSFYGVSGQPYPTPELLKGGVNLGFMYLPIYRGWVVIASIIVCLATWFVIEKPAWEPCCAPALKTPSWLRLLALTCRCSLPLPTGLVSGSQASRGYSRHPLCRFHR